MLVRSAALGRSVIRQEARHLSIFGSSAPKVPLDEEYPGTPQTVPTKSTADALTTTSVLSNGVRVVSHETHGAASTMGVFLGGGSRAESDSIRGASHLISRLAFVQRSTSKTGLRIVRDLDNVGAVGTSSTTRESIAFTATCLRPHLKVCAEAIGDVAFSAAFTPWDVAEGRDMLGHSLDATDDSARLADALYGAAFYDSETLGRPTLAPSESVGALSGPALADFMGSLTAPSNVVVAGVGVDHSELVSLAESICGHLPASAETVAASPAAQYVGGEARVRGASDKIAVSLAFPAPGVSQSAPFAVLAEVLGSGSQLFRHGRGKGNGRLGQAVPEGGFVRKAAAFCSTHSDAGLVGITAEAFPDQTVPMMEFMAAAFKGAASGVTDQECGAAKARLKMQIATAKPNTVLGDLAAQMLSEGQLSDRAQAIDAVTAADVAAAAQQALAAPPSVASIGAVGVVPRYNKVLEMFK